MLRNTIILALTASSILALGCGGSVPANKPTNTTGNTVANTKPDVPVTPMATPANTSPDVAANANAVSKNPTPIPANVSKKDVKKSAIKPVANGTSGIPDPDAIRKSMGQQPPPAQNSNSSLMMMKKKPANKP